MRKARLITGLIAVALAGAALAGGLSIARSAHAAGALNILDMAALASSPMRMRKSVPISAA